MEWLDCIFETRQSQVYRLYLSAYHTLHTCVVADSEKKYDEYQTGILATSFIATGIVLLLLFPTAFFMVLNDANYAVETISFLVVTHWSVFLLVNLIYLIKWYKQ